MKKVKKDKNELLMESGSVSVHASAEVDVDRDSSVDSIDRSMEQLT